MGVSDALIGAIVNDRKPLEFSDLVGCPTNPYRLSHYAKRLFGRKQFE